MPRREHTTVQFVATRKGGEPVGMAYIERPPSDEIDNLIEFDDFVNGWGNLGWTLTCWNGNPQSRPCKVYCTFVRDVPSGARLTDC